ncbi:hypothetical protein ACFGY2_11630 [Pasteurella multocida]
MNKKIGLSLIENNRIRLLLDARKAILFELRQGCDGFAPYDVMEITDKSEQQQIIDLATKYARTSFGVQSLFQTGENENTTQYESCVINFDSESIDKKTFLNNVSFLNGLNLELVEKIKSEKCTQIMISFPMSYPNGYLEENLEKLKNLTSSNNSF